MASEGGSPVELYIYDLALGLAPLLSPAIIGQRVDGVWHTAVVAFGHEYFYGGAGVTTCRPGCSGLGAPQRVEALGETFVPRHVFHDYVHGLAAAEYTGSAYRLLEHNCNHFSDDVAQFLCGARVPKHILRQPDALPPPLRLALQALLERAQPGPGHTAIQNGTSGVSRGESPEYCTLNDQIEEARAVSVALDARRSTLAEKLARKERRRQRKRDRLQANTHDIEEDDECAMSEAVESCPAGAVSLCERAGAGPSAGAGAAAAEDEVDERELAERRRRERDPPIVFTDIDGAAEFEKLCVSLEGATLSAEERQSCDELQQYLVRGEGSWVLGDEFLSFVERLLSAESGPAVRVSCLRCLCACALRDDVALLLHQDRKHHALLGYAQRIDTHTIEEQLATAIFICNLFEHTASSEWLLYISEWEAAGQPLSNIRATTKVCVHALLSESAELREVGTALVHNMATKERFQCGKALRDLLPRRAKAKVFDEVCVELCMAVLQLLQAAPAEEHLFRACRALARLAHHSQDVPQLIAVVGPDPAAFRGTSARVDDQIDLIMKKVK